MKAKQREAQPTFWSQNEKALSHWFEICCGFNPLCAQTSNKSQVCAGDADSRGVLGKAPVTLQ